MVLRKLAGHTAIYGLSTIVGRLLNYLLVGLYTRVFETAAYGVVTELFSYITFLNVIYAFGMETAFFHFAHKYPERKKNVFSSAHFFILSISGLITVLLLLSMNWIGQSLAYEDRLYLIQMVIGILLLDALAIIPFAYLRFCEKPMRFAVVKLTNIAVNIGANLLFLLLLPFIDQKWMTSLYQKEFGVGYIFLSNLLASGITVLLLLKEWKAIFKLPKISSSMLKEMLLYAAPLVIVGFAGMVNEALDRVMLKHLLPGEMEWRMGQLGIYGACYKLSIFMTLGIQAFRFGAEPLFFAQARAAGGQANYAKILTYFTFVGGLVWLGVMLFLAILKYFIGPEYHEGLKVVPILLMANLLLGVYYNVSIWYKVTANNSKGAAIAIAGAFLTFVVNYFGIPHYGYEASAWATLICYGFMLVVSVWWGRYHFPIPYQWKKVLALLLLPVLLWLLEVWLDASIAWPVIVQYVFKFLLIMTYLWVFMRMENHNFLIILRKISQRLKNNGA